MVQNYATKSCLMLVVPPLHSFQLSSAQRDNTMAQGGDIPTHITQCAGSNVNNSHTLVAVGRDKTQARVSTDISTDYIKISCY